MTKNGLQRKIDFKVACILSGTSLKQFAAAFRPPVTPGAVSLVLDQRGSSRRISAAIVDFIVEVKTLTDLSVNYRTDNLAALSKARSYRFKIPHNSPTHKRRT